MKYPDTANLTCQGDHSTVRAQARARFNSSPTHNWCHLPYIKEKAAADNIYRKYGFQIPTTANLIFIDALLSTYILEVINADLELLIILYVWKAIFISDFVRRSGGTSTVVIAIK